MAFCENCIHFDVCKIDYDMMSEEVVTFFPHNEDCKLFKSTADVVKVIRCKDCVNRVEFDTNKFHCELTGYYCGETGYCSDGTLILFDSENNAKIAKNLMEAKGIHTGRNICECEIDDIYAPKNIF